jgi:hypothetical protein
VSTAEERVDRLAARLRTERAAEYAAELDGDWRTARQHADVAKQLIDEALAPELRGVVRALLAEYTPEPVDSAGVTT